MTTSQDISPLTGAVAAFALPMPIDGVSKIATLIEDLYGTGASLLSYSGRSLQVSAPKDGFGPRLAPDTDGLALASARVETTEGEGEAFEMEAIGPDELLLGLGAVLGRYFSEMGATNYVTMLLRNHSGEPFDYAFTAQRTSGETPHQLREKAEARVAELEAQVADLRAQLGTPQPGP